MMFWILVLLHSLCLTCYLVQPLLSNLYSTAQISLGFALLSETYSLIFMHHFYLNSLVFLAILSAFTLFAFCIWFHLFNQESTEFFCSIYHLKYTWWSRVWEFYVPHWREKNHKQANKLMLWVLLCTIKQIRKMLWCRAMENS